MITVIGLGKNAGDLSLNAVNALKKASRVFLKSEQFASSKILKDLEIEFESLDRLFETAEDFDALNESIVCVLQEAAKKEDVCYCVDSSGTDDTSVRLLADREIAFSVYPAASKADHILAKVGGETGAQIFSAWRFVEKDVYVNAQPLVIYDLDSEFLAEEVKLKLAETVGDERKVLFFDGEKCREIFVYELDRQEHYDHQSALFLPRVSLTARLRFCFDDLLEIMDVLRSPNGCPWDREQTHESIRMNLIEEAYELAEAIDEADDLMMSEETGDVLLQAVFHAVIAQDRGAFSVTDVLSELCGKLVFRHSHIFASDSAADSQAALDTWEKNKQTEKGQDTVSRAISDIAATLPQLMRAQKVQKKAAKVGFDWETVDGAAEKVKEELSEVLASEGENRANEVGDLLFAVVNVARFCHCDAEYVLKCATDKFARRFRFVEERILAEGKKLSDCTLAEMDALWDEAKRKEKESL